MELNSSNHPNFFLRQNTQRLVTVVKWIFFSLFSGICIGLAGTAFYHCLNLVTRTRTEYPWLIFLLPAGGMLIVFLYRLFRNENDRGTNLVLTAISSGERIPLRMAPSIFLSTLITHLFGGSAGREGAALQLGGSIGNFLGKTFRMDEKDQHIMIMCGMSAAFSSVFGTPMAAAVFSMEVVTVGIMHYSALVPCVLASLAAHQLALFLGAAPEAFAVTQIPEFSLSSACLAALLAALCAVISVCFCWMLHSAEKGYRYFFKNPYVQAAAGGVLVLLLTFLVGNQNYNGSGTHLLPLFFSGEGGAMPEAVLLKMCFTALTIGAGFKGGEIVPAFFVGAAFGSLFAALTGCPADICTAVGMTSVFCGVTNCPITSLLISFELFGYEGMPYYLIAVAFSYMLSGYAGLYRGQKIAYSKFKTNYINRQAE